MSKPADEMETANWRRLLAAISEVVELKGV